MGLRPARVGGPRIEMEKFDKFAVIHNYGHGGLGVTLSEISADEVVYLCDRYLNE